MESAGIQVNQVHTRNEQHALSQFKTELPQMDWIAERMICIPAGWWIDELCGDRFSKQSNEDGE